MPSGNEQPHDVDVGTKRTRIDAPQNPPVIVLPHDQQSQSSTQIPEAMDAGDNSRNHRENITVPHLQTKHIYHNLQQAQPVTNFRESAEADSDGKLTITVTRDTVTYTPGDYNIHTTCIYVHD